MLRLELRPGEESITINLLFRVSLPRLLGLIDIGIPSSKLREIKR